MNERFTIESVGGEKIIIHQDTGATYISGVLISTVLSTIINRALDDLSPENTAFFNSQGNPTLDVYRNFLPPLPPALDYFPDDSPADEDYYGQASQCTKCSKFTHRPDSHCV